VGIYFVCDGEATLMMQRFQWPWPSHSTVSASSTKKQPYKSDSLKEGNFSQNAVSSQNPTASLTATQWQRQTNILFGNNPLPSFSDVSRVIEEKNLPRLKALLPNRVTPQSQDLYNRCLTLAAEDGTLPIVQYLVEQGANINNQSYYGDTPLISAVQANQAAVVTYLLSKGALANLASNYYRETPLSISVENGDIASTTALLNAGANLNAKNRYQRTPFLSAVIAGQVSIARLLAQRGADVQAKDNRGREALHYAVENRSPDMLNYLLSLRPANLSPVDEYGYTPAQLAINSGRTAQLNSLLSAGVSPNERVGNSTDPSLLVLAIDRRNIDMVEALIQAGANIQDVDEDGEPPLLHALRSRSESIIQRLLDSGASPNVTSRNGTSAILLAAQNGIPWMVQMLLSQNASLAPRSSDGLDPLMAACQDGSEEIVDMLIAAGMKADRVDKSGANALIYAVQSGTRILIEKILGLNPDINVFDASGQTALHWAARRTTLVSLSMFQPLLASGANPASRDFEFNTPLHYAANSGSNSKVTLLLGQNVKVNAQNKRGETPLHLAIKASSPELITTLVNAGANPNIKDATGETPLTLALKKREWESAMVLINKGARFPVENIQGIRSGNINDYYNLDNEYGRMMANMILDNQVTLLEKLLNQGFPPDIAGQNGRRPIDYAVESGKPVAFTLLRAKGASLNYQTGQGFSPLHYALTARPSSQSIAMVKALLSAGANPYLKDAAGQTPLHVGAAYAQPSVFKALIESLPKESLNQMDNQLETPLWIALENGSVELMGLLIRAGANPNFKNPETGQTVSHLAARRGYNDMLTALSQYRSVNFNAQDNNGDTPLLQAVQSGRTAAVEALLALPQVDLLIQNKKGQNALSLAKELDRERLANMIQLAINKRRRS
jgi:ankyrin repeat protein